MQLQELKEFFVTDDKKYIVEVERFRSGINPFDTVPTLNIAGGSDLNEIFKNVYDRLDEKTITAIEKSIKDFLMDKCIIRKDCNDYDVAVNEKDTGKFIQGYLYDADYDEIADDIFHTTKGIPSVTDNNSLYPWLQFCNNNDIDVSRILAIAAKPSDISENHIVLVYMTEDNIKEKFNVDNVYDAPGNEIFKYISGGVQLGLRWVDGNEFAYNKYNLKGELVDARMGFFGQDSQKNGIEKMAGKFAFSLGAFDSLEECLEEQGELVGIRLAPKLTLKERIEMGMGTPWYADPFFDARARNEKIFAEQQKEKLKHKPENKNLKLNDMER